VVAYRQDVIERNVQIVFDLIGRVLRQINAVCGHGCYRTRINPMGLDPGRIDLQLVTAIVGKITMCNLTPARVACTKD